MEKAELKIDYTVFEDSFPVGYEHVCQAAREAARRAYNPYSRFAVGAAVLLANGEIVTGSNQENIAYPSGLCAERVALFYATSAYPGVKVNALAIAALQGDVEVEKWVTPCGACRQVMTEIIRRYQSDFDVILLSRRQGMMVKASSLLPFAFSM